MLLFVTALMQIAANITCYIHPGGRPNAANPSRLTRRLAERIATVERKAIEREDNPSKAVLHMNHDAYDSWIGYSSQRGPKHCDELESAAVTRMVEQGLTIGSEYVAGDMRWLPVDEADQDGDVEAESDQTAVHEGSGAQETISVPQDLAVVKVEELEAGPTGGTEVPVEMIREPGANAVLAEATETLPAREPSISRGDEQDFDGELDVDMTISETMSHPSWAFILD